MEMGELGNLGGERDFAAGWAPARAGLIDT